MFFVCLLYALKKISRDFKWLDLKNYFPVYAYFTGEQDHRIPHATSMEVELLGKVFDKVNFIKTLILQVWSK